MNLKTPGVYVKDASPVLPQVEVIETGLPIFIGFTEWAENEAGDSLHLTPTRIQDLGEYSVQFGGGYRPIQYDIYLEDVESKKIKEVRVPVRMYLYESLLQFYDNGGRDCFILSVGLYEDIIVRQTDPSSGIQTDSLNSLTLIAGLEKGLDVLRLEDDPDLVLYPDAMVLGLLDSPDLQSVSQLYQRTLRHCDDRKDRFLIADVMMNPNSSDPIDEFRDLIGINHLKFGAAYYPYLFSNYTHVFHFHELRLFEHDSRGNPASVSHDQMTGTSDLNSAQLQQEMVAEAERWNAVILQMINLLNQADLNRDTIEDLPNWVIRSSRQIDVSTPESIQNFFNGIRAIVLSFQALDGNIPPLLQVELVRKITTENLANQTESLISWEKSEAIRALFDPDRSIEEVEEAYTTLSGTQWINAASVEEIAEANIDAQTPEETVQWILDQYLPVAISIAYSLKSLFQEAFTQEKNAEDQLFSSHPFYKRVFESLDKELKTLPPSGTIAGIYAQTDQDRGVFKAPANVKVQATLGPAIFINDQQQESLNVHHTGKSINAIRAITGRGTRVWGARTLDGNSREWRYVSVRRYFNFVEEVLKKSAENFVFESNDANTWVRIRMFLRTFLLNQWRGGALNGNTPDEAFFIKIGLDESMTAQDVLEGRMIIEIGLAVVRPAEFIVVRYICRMENI